jgi:hypothetical protein
MAKLEKVGSNRVDDSLSRERGEAGLQQTCLRTSAAAERQSQCIAIGRGGTGVREKERAKV